MEGEHEVVIGSKHCDDVMTMYTGGPTVVHGGGCEPVCIRSVIESCTMSAS